jgi:purine nucleosidase
LTPSFELHGIISAHFGTRKSSTSQNDSHNEILHLLDLMGLQERIPVQAGAPRALPDAVTPVPSEGSALIIVEAMKDDPRPLHVAFLGPLTDMASALLQEPAIAERNITVIWIGGADWPVGGPEYNLSNDINAANVVFRSKVRLWQK